MQPHSTQANVLISDTGEALLAGFGLAAIVEDVTKLPLSAVLQDCSSIRWMAPELLIELKRLSRETDVWALGMVILEVSLLSDKSIEEIANGNS